MSINKTPSREYLNECFSHVDGVLTWKRRPDSHFPQKGARNSAAIANMWNAKHAGKRAGSVLSSKKGKYRIVRLDGAHILEHRVIAVIVGIPVDGVIDHVDGNGLNNHPSNLRSATQQQNCLNRLGWRKRQGRPGVYERQLQDGTPRWIAIYAGRSLGTFSSKQEAESARSAAEDRHRGEFSPNRREHAFGTQRGVEWSETSLGRGA